MTKRLINYKVRVCCSCRCCRRCCRCRRRRCCCRCCCHRSRRAIAAAVTLLLLRQPLLHLGFRVLRGEKMKQSVYILPLVCDDAPVYPKTLNLLSYPFLISNPSNLGPNAHLGPTREQGHISWWAPAAWCPTTTMRKRTRTRSAKSRKRRLAEVKTPFESRFVNQKCEKNEKIWK